MKKDKTGNLEIHPRTDKVATYYNAASLVVNLSDKSKFIETFGMTALEAMSDGLPTIVPTEGGIAEVVEDGKTGYKIDVTEPDKIAHSIECMLTDKELYYRLSANALRQSKKYDRDTMVDSIMGILTKKQERNRK